ncbi:MAG: hypothetical protein NNA31_06295 [Nitrospira sp.]|nr:hypothetical protein [Nitrospira sp.]
MKDMIMAPPTTRLQTIKREPFRLWESAAWLLRCYAERWKERARFYEKYRGYFPKLSSGRFVKRCRELEKMYQKLSMIMLAVPVREEEWVPVRLPLARRKRGRLIVRYH